MNDKKLLFSKHTNKRELMKRMAKIPEGYTHVGVGNIRPGQGDGEGGEVRPQVTVIIAGELMIPRIWDADTDQWKELVW